MRIYVSATTLCKGYWLLKIKTFLKGEKRTMESHTYGHKELHKKYCSQVVEEQYDPIYVKEGQNEEQIIFLITYAWKCILQKYGRMLHIKPSRGRSRRHHSLCSYVLHSLFELVKQHT